jgi:hypothetical protein
MSIKLLCIALMMVGYVDAKQKTKKKNNTTKTSHTYDPVALSTISYDDIHEMLARRRQLGGQEVLSPIEQQEAIEEYIVERLGPPPGIGKQGSRVKARK